MDNRVLIVDTIWCRLLCTLERLEILENINVPRTTECHDLKAKNPPKDEDRDDLIAEFNLQKKAFTVAVKPIMDHIDRYRNDYAGWCAGRVEKESSLLDGLCMNLGLQLIGKGGFELHIPEQSAPSEGGGAPDSQGGNIGLKVADEEHSHNRGAAKDGQKYLIDLDARLELLVGNTPTEDHKDSNVDQT